MAHNAEYRASFPSVEELAGQELKRLRTERGWSQEEVARRMTSSGYDWHQTTVGRTESASRPLRVNEVVVLAAIFDVPITQLLVPTAAKLSDIDEAVTTSEKFLTEARKMLADFQPTLDNLSAAHASAVEAHRKLTGGIENVESRLQVLRAIQRVIKRGHQLPPDMVAQLATFRELVTVPGLAEALEAHEAQQ